MVFTHEYIVRLIYKITKQYFLSEYLLYSHFLIRFIMKCQRNKKAVSNCLNKWYHSYQNHTSYQIVTKKEEQNHVAVKS